MSERDELAGAVVNAFMSADEMVHIGTARAAADAILAAGYVKPRTITTAEELGALACGSVFRDDNERIWEVEKIGYGGVEKALSAMGIGSMIAFSSFRDFPATVLYEPTA